jgi:large subunit ribosomal protein L30
MKVLIRLRGRVGLRKGIIDTLKFLRLNRKMNCVLLENTPTLKGMLQKVKDIITWGDIDDETLRLLIQKRGRKLGDKRLEEKEVEKVFNDIKQGKKLKIKPVFRLSPPSKGFKKSIKQHYPKGELGYRGDKINELLKRMI